MAIQGRNGHNEHKLGPNKSVLASTLSDIELVLIPTKELKMVILI